MRAIKIDPWKRTISEIELADGIDPLYAALSTGEKRVDTFCSVTLMRAGHFHETLWVDDEGLLEDGIPVFYIGTYPNPLAGVGIITGVDEQGNSVDTRLKSIQLMQAVKWTDKVTTGQLGPTVEEKDEETGFFTIKVGGPILRDKGETKH